MLANVTKVADNIQSEDVAIASSLLDRVANSTDIQADMEVSQRNYHFTSIHPIQLMISLICNTV